MKGKESQGGNRGRDRDKERVSKMIKIHHIHMGVCVGANFPKQIQSHTKSIYQLNGGNHTKKLKFVFFFCNFESNFSEKNRSKILN